MLLDQFIKIKSYEKIECVVRRHPVTFVPAAVLFLLGFFIPHFVAAIIDAQLPGFWQVPIIFPGGVVVLSMYYLFLISLFYTVFVDFYLDFLILTNDRLIDFEQATIFSRTITEIDLHEVLNASSEEKGFFASLFKYGNLYIETAASQRKCIARNVPHPHELRRVLLQLAAVDKHYHRT